MNRPVIAIVPAAGIGRRFGDQAKQFVMLCGRPLLAWPLEVLEAIPEISEIIPVARREDRGALEKLLMDFGITKARRIADGGPERQDSVANALTMIGDRDLRVLIHDGARPLADASLVRRVLDGLDGCDGVVPGVPVKDTVKEGADGIVLRTVPREGLWAIQTPQVFGAAALFAAHEHSLKQKSFVTDDASLVEQNGGRVRIVMGSYENIKITTPEDLMVAELFLSRRGRLP